MHVLRVTGVLQDLHLQLGSIQHHIENERARNQLLYGGVRRSRFVWDGLRDFYKIAHPKRDGPLKQDESFQLERALNDIYIHSRGLFDNMAWSIFALYLPKDIEQIRPTDVDLFRVRTLRKNGLDWLVCIIEPFLDWHSDFKTRRDPVAHRIPLSVPPSIVTTEQAKARQELYEAWWQAGQDVVLAMQRNESSDVVAAKEKEKEGLFEELESIGTFCPYMSVDPDRAPVPLYPTVAEDVGVVVEISWKILTKMSNDWVQR